MKSFLTGFLTNSECQIVREDYKELAMLSLLYLGGSLSEGIPIYAPGAYTHARWMARVIYTVKIVLFREQLGDVFETDSLNHLERLATFLVLYYVPYWFSCMKATEAAVLDLRLLKELEEIKIRDDIGEFAEVAYQKMQGHLWYLSE